MTIKNPNKKSIWFSDEVLPMVGNPQTGYSARVVGIVKAHNAIIKESMPTLAQEEWLLICDMLNGCVLDERSPHFLAADIAECAAEDGLSSKWDTDGLMLAQRVDKMSTAEKFAIQEVAFRFWSETGIVSDYRQKLIDCGAKVS